MGEVMNNKEQSRKRHPAEQPKVDWKTLEIVHPDAAGIDIGGREHWVAISPDRDEDPVRRLHRFSADLEAVAEWLVGKRGCSVGVESTRVYRVPRGGVLGQTGVVR